MKHRRTILIIPCIVGITAVAFFPRGLSSRAYWTPDEILWIERSLGFISALSQGDLKRTVQSFHPGVTTTWVGSASLYTKYRNVLFMFKNNRAPFPVDSQENLQRVRIGMAIIVTLLILSFFFLLRSLINLKIAITASIFLALDPWYLMESRRLHTDALAAGFIILSILSLLIYWEKENRAHLLISGICLGLSCLSKVTSITLIPYFSLGFALHRTLYQPGGTFDRKVSRRNFISWGRKSNPIWRLRCDLHQGPSSGEGNRIR